MVQAPRSQKKLVKRCKNGDQQAQFELYRNYVDSMYNIAMRFFNNIMDAEDVVQESFVQAFTQISHLNHEASFGGWLKRIVVNKCISTMRKQKIRFHFIDETYHDCSTDEEVDEGIDPEEVNKAIKGLPVVYRTIINLHVFAHKKHKEIAEILEITESTSKARYKKAKQLLAESLTEVSKTNEKVNI